jgi:hypothetical protein
MDDHYLKVDALMSKEFHMHGSVGWIHSFSSERTKITVETCKMRIVVSSKGATTLAID